MNRYNNVAGYHNPRKTIKDLSRINALCKHKFVDASWHNDACDNVYNEEHAIYIFIPNSKKSNLDNEEFNTYTVQKDDPVFFDDNETVFESDNLHEVIKFINDNL